MPAFVPLALYADPVFGTTFKAVCAVLIALFLHMLVEVVLARAAGRRAAPRIFLVHTRNSLRLLLPSLALQAIWANAPADYPWLATLRHATLLLNIAAATWIAVALSMALRDIIARHFPADVQDNLQARRILTQTNILMRTLSGVVIVIGFSAGLMTFPDVRQIGASLIASAGLAGLVLGFAAKPVLGNIIAGLQIAMTQPIRIDDVLIVEGEWGRVEEITGAYVVVKIWDERRMVVPLQWFIEHPFQNWTRKSAHIIGTVFLWADYRMPVEPLRRELEGICRAAPEWDGTVCLLQVTEGGEHAMQLRALVSSQDSGLNWDLRCRVREGLIAFLQRDYPDALPRLRAEMVESAASHQETGAADGKSAENSAARKFAVPERRRRSRI